MESDEEIEYLDEDADIVQQCVQNVSLPITQNENVEEPLLVERQPASKKKKLKMDEKMEEEDSDYDPRDDMPTPPFNRIKKKKPIPNRPPPKPVTPQPFQMLKFATKKPLPEVVTPKSRNKMNIRIPDYDDPLCLPVKAITRDNLESKKLKTWNNACISHLRHSDKLLRPEKGVTKGSSRTVVLKNVLNRETGKYETAVWARTCVENEHGLKKSQNFQSILPKFQEKKVLEVNMVFKKPKKTRHVDEVILTKEMNKTEETLVVYKPKESLSAVYKMIEPVKSDQGEHDSDKRRALRELSCCKLCAACYQVSWRGVRGGTHRKHISCAICARTFVSVYNLLTHVRAHTHADVRAHTTQLAATLAGVVDYHYKCRICQETFLSIASLRQHVAGHKGNQMFICEVGNHMAS